jgi:hypothetical protein
LAHGDDGGNAIIFFMNEDLEKSIQDIKYTLETIIGLIALLMLIHVAILFIVFLYWTST